MSRGLRPAGRAHRRRRCIFHSGARSESNARGRRSHLLDGSYETTDREVIRKPGEMRVCRILTTADECGKVVARWPAQQGSEISRRDHPLEARFTDTLTPDLHANL